jgi:hypothetical protein
MFSLSTKVFRRKAAVTLATLYAFCVVAPSAAFAFADGAVAAHCLMEGLAVEPISHAGGSTVHVHADGTTHHHGASVHVHSDGSAHHHPDVGLPDSTAVRTTDSGEKGSSGECCGLFPMVAVSSEPRPAFGPSRLASIAMPVLTDALIGRGPERINRPPIA